MHPLRARFAEFEQTTIVVPPHLNGDEAYAAALEYARPLFPNAVHVLPLLVGQPPGIALFDEGWRRIAGELWRLCGADAARGLIREVVFGKDATAEECQDAEWHGTAPSEGGGRRVREPHERAVQWLVVIGRDNVWRTRGFHGYLKGAKRSLRLQTSRGLGDGRIFETREDGSTHLYRVYTHEDYLRGAKC